ncbi:DUF6482 family protein [Shewanella waksmanii]|uniref:DUF6482 family protein n=1 Tax=Shewanella waksmanii TaxID=213783 RepID=UPI003735089C
MHPQQLAKAFENNHLYPAIINTADATHYLVGGADPQGNFVQLSTNQHAATPCLSFEHAKQLLRNLGAEEAHFTLHTAYDEMIGVPTEHCLTTMKLKL